MSIKKEKIEEREQALIDILKGNPGINERIWELIKEKKLMAKQTYFNTRNKLSKEGKIRIEKVGRQVWLYLPEDEELFRKKAGLGIKEEKMTHILYDRKIDEAIEKLIKKSNWIPELNEIGIDIEKDPENPEVHSIIFERLAKIKKVAEVIDNTLEAHYKDILSIRVKGKKIEWLRRPKYSINERLPSDDIIIKEAEKSIDISDIDISLIKKLIQLGKTNLESKKTIRY